MIKIKLHYVNSGDRADFSYIGKVLFGAIHCGYDVSTLPDFRHEPIKAKDINRVVEWLVTNFPHRYTIGE